MQIILGATPVQIPGNRSRPVIQNLGPGAVYLDTDGDVDETSGLMIPVHAVYEFPDDGGNNTGIFIMADTEGTDVRVVGMS